MGDFLTCKPRKSGSLEGKFFRIGAEKKGSFGIQQTKSLCQEGNIIDVDVKKSLHLFRAGEGRRIDNDYVVKCAHINFIV